VRQVNLVALVLLASPPQLLLPNEPIPEAVRPGERALALCERQLVETTVVLRRERSAAPCEPVLLLVGFAALRAGPVEVATCEPGSHELRTTGSVRCDFKGRSYAFRREVVGQNGFRLVLSGAGRDVRLFETETSDDGFARISWVGDVDRDGELDCFVVTASKYTWHDHRAFLSSGAKDGGLKQVATQGYGD
jgi:hypothetical protein